MAQATAEALKSEEARVAQAQQGSIEVGSGAGHKVR